MKRSSEGGVWWQDSVTGYLDQRYRYEGALMQVDVGDGEGLGVPGTVFIKDDIEIDFAGTPANPLFSA